MTKKVINLGVIFTCIIFLSFLSQIFLPENKNSISNQNINNLNNVNTSSNPIELWNHTANDRIYSVAISEDGNYIASSSGDGTVFLFNKTSSRPMWSYITGDEVRSVAISANGTYIVAASFDGRVYLFNKTSS